jgi:hypothetical protein
MKLPIIVLALVFTLCGATAQEKDKPLSSGSGFAIDSQFVVTNEHVVHGCPNMGVRMPGVWQPAVVVALDERNDLAVLKVQQSTPARLAFRADQRIKLGESVLALGYPLQGIGASSMNLTTGTVSALAGLADDSRFFQFTAPVQPGNSGGPLLDQSGNVIGVVTSKLSPLWAAQAIGDLPQNVNFAIRASVIQSFLDEHHVRYNSLLSQKVMEPTDVASKTKAAVVLVGCFAQPRLLVNDDEILSDGLFGVASEDLPDGPISEHAYYQIHDAEDCYSRYAEMRDQIDQVYKGGHVNKSDVAYAGLEANISICAMAFDVIVRDYRWDENAEIDRLLDLTELDKEFRNRLNSLTIPKETLLQRLEAYQEVFRDVLRRYALYTKAYFVQPAWRESLGPGGRTESAKNAIIDIYYPYLNKPVTRSADPQERQDALDLLTSWDSIAKDEQSAESKGVAILCFQNVVISPEQESRLSDAELLALRKQCYWSSEFLGNLMAYVTSKRDSALPLMPPPNRPEVKEALAWWLYWRLTPEERVAWHKYCRNVDAMMKQVDEILRKRGVRR